MDLREIFYFSCLLIFIINIKILDGENKEGRKISFKIIFKTNFHLIRFE